MKDRLLILDDDPEFTSLTGTIAETSGYEVLEITDPIQFESTLRSWSPSHVMVDLYVPDIDGFEALQILARWKSPARIVICSAAAREVIDAVDRLGKRLNLNMSGIIEKPHGATELKALLEGLRSEGHGSVAASQSFDRSFFDETCEAMGREWVRRSLANLIAQVESTFTGQTSTSPDLRQLARSAHTLVAHAGLLGFSEFSQLCRALEEACNTGGDISLPLSNAQAASCSACVKAREIIAEMEESQPS